MLTSSVVSGILTRGMRIVIVVTLGDASGQKIGHLSHGGAHKVDGGMEHGLEGGSVRRGAGRKLSCGRIEDCGAVGEEIKGLAGLGAGREFGFQAGECRWGKALKELESRDLLCNLDVGLV